MPVLSPFHFVGFVVFRITRRVALSRLVPSHSQEFIELACIHSRVLVVPARHSFASQRNKTSPRYDVTYGSRLPSNNRHSNQQIIQSSMVSDLAALSLQNNNDGSCDQCPIRAREDSTKGSVKTK